MTSHTEQLAPLTSHTEQLPPVTSHTEQLAPLTSHTEQLPPVTSHTEQLAPVTSHTEQLGQVHHLAGDPPEGLLAGLTGLTWVQLFLEDQHLLGQLHHLPEDGGHEEQPDEVAAAPRCLVGGVGGNRFGGIS